MRYLLCCLVFCSCASQTKDVGLMYGCPIIRVERVDDIVRSDGTMWKVMRLNVCGEKKVWERRNLIWKDVSWKMR